MQEIDDFITMDHTQIITPTDLEGYAPSREGQSLIPELVYRLVNVCPGLTVCRIPYGDNINQPGFDGKVSIKERFRQFVPEGNSVWEIGTGSDPSGKATEVFAQRTGELTPEELKTTAFVFVTPRSRREGRWTEPEQRKWLDDRKDSGWREIKIIDGDVLANWLCEFPGIAKWLRNKISGTSKVSGFSTPAEHWENIQTFVRAGDPPLPPALFLEGRDQARRELLRLFDGEVNQMIVAADNQYDVEDFVAAFLESLPPETGKPFSDRCLFIDDENTWFSIIQSKARQVLVAHPRLGLDSFGEKLHAEAIKRGHAVVISLSGAGGGGGEAPLRLRNPGAATIEKILMEAKYSDLRARELATSGAQNLAALKRNLRGMGALPPYSSWDNAALLAQAAMMGSWVGLNTSDKAALEMFLGKSYGEWIELIRPETLRLDTPLMMRNENWKIITRGEAWTALGRRLTDNDLDRFQQMAVTVLSETDPKLSLPSEERMIAGFRGNVIKHSNLLRKGIAETLALLGSKPKALSSCTEGKPETVALLTIRELLKNADWQTWASLNHLLPLLAEAAPKEFLDAVEAGVNSTNNPFREVFSKEESGITGWNHMTGVLWALENLAWHPDYLVRVTLLLGELAAIDPGGNWANRPANSLSTIFLPWHPQTCGDIPKRKTAIEALVKEQPIVAWKLLLALLPSTHGMTMGSHKPAWRDFISSNWREGVTVDEYWQQVNNYAELIVSIAATDLQKLAELIEHLSDLPAETTNRILQHLGSDAVSQLPEAQRLPLWESLVDLAANHRYFNDAQWAMNAESVTTIENTASKIAPKDSRLTYRRLFSNRDFTLFDTKLEQDNYMELERRLRERRQAAIAEIINTHGLDDVVEFAKQVASPDKVGLALGIVGTESMDSALLPKYLGAADKAVFAFISGFVWSRLTKGNWPWVDTVPMNSWDHEQKLAFLTLLPFVKETWQIADRVLGSKVGDYWRKANVSPWAASDGLVDAVKQLLEIGRPYAAIECLSKLVFAKTSFPHELAEQALLDSLTAKDQLHGLDQHHAIQLIKWLQTNPDTNGNELFKIEWYYLPLLNRFSGGSPKALEKRLATDPSFFCEVIQTIFRSDKKELEKSEPSEERKKLASNAYRLLYEWHTPPGLNDDKSFNSESFHVWLNAVKSIATKSGHLRFALDHIGQVLPYTPPDVDGLWINHSVAEALNTKDAGEMRSGFTRALINMRGVFTFTAGKEEREIAEKYRKKADALEQRGYSRFATAMRELVEYYERSGEHEANKDPYND